MRCWHNYPIRRRCRPERRLQGAVLCAHVQDSSATVDPIPGHACAADRPHITVSDVILAVVATVVAVFAFQGPKVDDGGAISESNHGKSLKHCLAGQIIAMDDKIGTGKAVRLRGETVDRHWKQTAGINRLLRIQVGSCRQNHRLETNRHCMRERLEADWDKTTIEGHLPATRFRGSGFTKYEARGASQLVADEVQQTGSDATATHRISDDDAEDFGDLVGLAANVPQRGGRGDNGPGKLGNSPNN